MKLRGSSLLLRGVSLVFVLLATVLIVFQLVQYSTSRSNYPADMTIGGIAVGGLDPQAATQRLLQVYASPVEIHYSDATIDLEPDLVGFQLDTESMLAAADLQRTGASFWGGFWDYVWNRPSPASQIPLVASYSEDRLRVYLQSEISARYDQPPTAAQPIPGTSNFTPGTPGQTLDIDRAVVLIDSALRSPDQRTVMLTSQRIVAGRPSLQTLQVLLKQIIDQNSFPGIMDIYFLDLQSGEEMHFAYQQGQDISINPEDIAFSADSTIKIPIMVSIFRQVNSKIDDTLDSLLKLSIDKSNNDATDSLMKSLDQVRGPLVVYETMQKLGLRNTFISMYFYLGALNLQSIETPANKRTDISTNPDDTNQTTPEDVGMLLEDIYQCAQTSGGSLVAAFPGQINQVGCQQMLLYLEADNLGNLIQGGVPEGTLVAHKHGWDNYENQFGDAAIIFTPGGNYVLTIYSYNPEQFQWDVTNRIYSEISRAIYNYFNLPTR